MVELKFTCDVSDKEEKAEWARSFFEVYSSVWSCLFDRLLKLRLNFGCKLRRTVLKKQFFPESSSIFLHII